MCIVYILYSESVDRFYIGSTTMDISQRLGKHLTDHKGFTARAKDWQVVFQQEKDSISEAKIFEKKIKNWKSRKMLEQLISQSG